MILWIIQKLFIILMEDHGIKHGMENIEKIGLIFTILYDKVEK